MTTDDMFSAKAEAKAAAKAAKAVFAF